MRIAATRALTLGLRRMGRLRVSATPSRSLGTALVSGGQKLGQRRATTLQNLRPVGSYKPRGMSSDVTSANLYKTNHDPGVARLPGQPDAEVLMVEIQKCVAPEFEGRYRAIPEVIQFHDTFNPSKEVLEKITKASALIIYDILKRRSPLLLNLLQTLANSYKGLSAEHAPHALIKGLKFRPVDRIPKSDDPAKDPEWYKAQAPYPPEMGFMFGLAKLMGFDALIVPGEKAALPAHVHTQVKGFERSGTSVCSVSQISWHTEDAHRWPSHGFFMLLGVMGNEAALTPLIPPRSFMSVLPEAYRSRLIDGMHLPYLNRPGAGRSDGYERAIIPMLNIDWQGRESLMFNGAAASLGSQYHNVHTGAPIDRHNLFPLSWYRGHPEILELHQYTRETLVRLFMDVPQIVKTSPFVWPLSIEGGDLVLVSNRVGAHARTPFTGDRLIYRTYVSFVPGSFWGWANSIEEQAQLLQGALPKPSPAAAAALSAMGRLDTVIDDLNYIQNRLFYLHDAEAPIKSLEAPLRILAQALNHIRKHSSIRNTGYEDLRHVYNAVTRCANYLSPLRMNLNEANLEEEIGRLRTLGTSDAIPEIAATIQETLAVLKSTF